MYEVLVKKKVLKDIEKLPEAIQKTLVNLIDDFWENRNIRLSLPSVEKMGGLLALRKEIYNYRGVLCRQS